MAPSDIASQPVGRNLPSRKHLLTTNDTESMNNPAPTVKVAVNKSARDDAKPIVAVDEYEWDSSDEEDIRNTVGNIPMEWYKEYPHLGYDWRGKRIIKPATPDEIDKFIRRIDAGGVRPVVFDEKTGHEIALKREDIDLIRRLRYGAFPDASLDPYLPSYETDEVAVHPINDRMPTKRSFLPSRGDKEKISKLVHAIKMGWLIPNKPAELKKDTDDGEEHSENEDEKLYDLWPDDDETAAAEDDEKETKSSRAARSRKFHYIPAPKVKQPGHEESYNPPEEYLFTPEEREKWKSRHPTERYQKFQPKKYTSMRIIPAWKSLTRERFERCLDLYLAPRKIRMRIQVNPEDLLPELPKPRDLQPFPTINAIIYRGHKSHVRCITVQPGGSGQFMASGSDDGTVRIWEVSTGRCLRTITVAEKSVAGGGDADISTNAADAVEQRIMGLAWCPNTAVSILAVGVGTKVFILNAGVGDRLIVSSTEQALTKSAKVADDAEPVNDDDNDDADDADGEGKDKQPPVKWRQELLSSKNQYQQQQHHQRVLENLRGNCVDLAWHPRGDYFATVTNDPTTSSTAVIVHQLSKQRSHVPFQRKLGLVQRVMFHPSRPVLFIATQTSIYVYELLKRELMKKLQPNCRWISSMAIHPSSGDHVLVGSYDTKISWIDMDLGTKPYQVLRYHAKAVRGVAYHSKYPLFATCSDDGTVVVCHAMVYNDVTKNPLIVPLKILKGHSITAAGLGVLACVWHPQQPWVFSAGADFSVRLYS